MTSAKLVVIDDQITENINKMLERAGNGAPFLKRVVYPAYKNAQRARWMTENKSQGKKWGPLNKAYADYKVRRYGGGTKYRWVGGRGESRPWVEDGTWPSYPGKGKKMMIATGKLVDSVTGKDRKYHRSKVTRSEIIVATTLPYAPDAAEVRPFMEFNKKFYEGMRLRWRRYVASGATKGKG